MLGLAVLAGEVDRGSVGEVLGAWALAAAVIAGRGGDLEGIVLVVAVAHCRSFGQGLGVHRSSRRRVSSGRRMRRSRILVGVAP